MIGGAPGSVASIPDLPELASERLILRQRDARDLEALIALNGDPAVMRFIHGVEAPDQRRQTALSRIASRFADGLGYWSVLRREAPETMIGYVGLLPIDRIGPGVEISYRFFPAHQGRGFAVEAVSALLRHGFETLGLLRVEIHTHPENSASLRLADRLGSQRVGTVETPFGTWVRLALSPERFGSAQLTARR